MVKDAGDGYSNVVQFSNPGGGKSSEYQGVGFQVENVAGERPAPVIVARNVGTGEAILRARVPYTRTDDTTGVVELPPTRLRAGEMRLLDARQVTRRSRREQIQVAGLEVEYDAAPGSVIVNAHSVGAGGDQVFRVPLWDPFGQRSPTGGYPWRIEGTSTTMTYIKNITDREQYYVASLRWPGGEGYMLGMKPIAPHQTVEIDIKRLRDEQVPDVAGRVIPPDVASGQLMWSLKQVGAPPAGEEARQALALMGRTEQVDLERGVSSNYACQNCCSDSYYASTLSPGGGDVEADASLDFDAYQQDKDCYGAITLPYPRTDFDGPTSWSSSDTGTATVSGSGVAAAVAAGETTIKATWTDYRYDTRFVPCFYYEEGQPPVPCNDCNNPLAVQPGPSATLRVRPQITITRNGTAITSTQNVIVGQQMSLAATVRGGTPTSQQWTIPGTRIADYEVVCNVVGEKCQGPTSGAAIPLTSVSNSSIQYYWVDGADNRQVQYTVTVRGREYSRAVTFNVKRPTASITTQTDGINMLRFSSGLLQLIYGRVGAVGIAFTRTIEVPSGFTGDTIWAQVVNPSVTRTIAGSGQQQTFSGVGLDDRFPYSVNDPNATSTADSPGFCLENCADGVQLAKVQVNSFDATMWLMFKPGGEGSIYVPLRKVGWDWAATATNLFGWRLSNTSNTVNPSGVDTTEFPQWTRNAGLNSYQ